MMVISGYRERVQAQQETLLRALIVDTACLALLLWALYRVYTTW